LSQSLWFLLLYQSHPARIQRHNHRPRWDSKGICGQGDNEWEECR
jgi:hypothetical protein